MAQNRSDLLFCFEGSVGVGQDLAVLLCLTPDCCDFCSGEFKSCHVL